MAEMEARDQSQIQEAIVNTALAQTRLSDYSTGAVVRVMAGGAAAELSLANLENVRASGLTFIPGLVGEDLDRRLADFGLTREEPVAAFGQVRFYRKWEADGAPGGTDASPVVVAAGYTVTGTAFDGTTVTYELRANVTIPAGQVSATGIVDALTPGSIGNVGAGRINTLSAPVVGLAGVGNDRAVGTGADDESDEAFRDRFYRWLDSLKPGTIPGLKAGALLYTEVDANGEARPVVGSVGVVEHLVAPGGDDGQVVSLFVAGFDGGALSAAQIADIQHWIDATGPYDGQNQWGAAGCPVKVLSPVFLEVNIEVEISLGPAGSSVTPQRLRRDLELVANATASGRTLYRHSLYGAISRLGNELENSTIIAPPGDVVAGVGQKVRAGSVLVRVVD